MPVLQTRLKFASRQENGSRPVLNLPILMDRGRVDVVQPDIGRVGGITYAVRVVQMAMDRGKVVIPHCWKTGIGIAATAQVAAASPNCRFIEFLTGVVAESQLRRELVADELRIENERISLPERPGLGIELNPRAMSKFAEYADGLAPVQGR